MPRIELLPPELLHIIFTFIHFDFELTTTAFEKGLSRPEIDIYPAFHHDQEYDTEVTQFLVEQKNQITVSKSSSLFPYALAAVCSTWKNVLSISPSFWTRVVLLVDSPPTAMEDARRYLQWSRQLPIDVFLLRASEFRVRDIFHNLPEQQRVADFIGLLQPHMHRCRSLHVDVTVNSSLPHVSDIVPSQAPLLRSLSLTCDFDYMLEEKLFIAPPRGPEVRTRLQTMEIDGHSFLRAYLQPPRWFEYQPQLRHLGISTFDHRFSSLSLHQTLCTLDFSLNFALSSLGLTSVNFEVDTDDTEADQFFFDRLQELKLEEIKPEALFEFLRVAYFPRLMLLHLRGCEGLGKGVFDVLQPELPMLAISKPESSAEEIRSLLSGWRGIALYLSGSTTPYDYVVNDLTGTGTAPAAHDTPTPPPTSPLPVACRQLQILIFLACPLPSFSSIKKMIEVRNSDVDYDDPDWRTNTAFGPAIGILEVRHCWAVPEPDSLDSPMWTQEERDWVKSKVVTFTWIDVSLR
ncbi:hypothetical protein GALMADRAFT_152160 [Galerina marginata CBS 339.88]|uniref:F-box domain-containing protein n=1 Tax=Galerina marginata (strain CBS 339.88) TaxID=685588 RepID=A0A067TTG5_GALM3|nr:hypothetical protein GALMADRAFT_152160 [Galerina marginata CBS 339.88]